MLSWVTTGTDEMGAPVGTWQQEAVVNDALVAPGPTSDLTGAIRPDGDHVEMIIHLPKTFTGPLRGRRCLLRGRTWEVVGDPLPYTTTDTPTRWDRPATIKEVMG